MDRIDGKIKVDWPKSFDKVQNRAKYSNGKNRKMAKSEILIRPKIHDFSSKSKNTELQISGLDFFILKAKLVFPKLRQAFIEVSILHHFWYEISYLDSNWYIGLYY